MKKIPLTQGKFALVDDIDFDRLNKHKWYALKIRYAFYAVRNITKPDGKQTLMLMHREVLGLKPGDPRQADHRNHNGLDNRRDKIRICSNSQNQYNQSPQENGSSAFKGVFWEKRAEKWRARIKVNGKEVKLGYFVSEVEAAKAYDAMAIEYYGEFALPNFNHERAQKCQLKIG